MEYSLDLSSPPEIEVTAEVNNQATQEEKYVVRYRIDPPVC